MAAAGRDLLSSLTSALGALPEFRAGPQKLADRLGLDKVIASRLLKGLRSTSPMEAVHRLPGPAPLRRVIAGCEAAGVEPGTIEAARLAIDSFERLIRDGPGNRSGLETLLSSYVPEARRDFELRRKQSAFRAMSQLKGVEAELILGTVLLAPGATPGRIDVVWLTGLFGLQRLRPGVHVKFATRRFTPKDADRAPRSLDGDPVEDLRAGRMEAFCSTPAPEFRATRIGEVIQYALADEGFGPGGQRGDLVFCEVNRNELPRVLPAASSRKAYFFAEVQSPAQALSFDVLVHNELYTAGEPELRIYDTVLEGVADVNDPARESDRFDLAETIRAMGIGRPAWRSDRVPRYSELVSTVFTRLAWNSDDFRGYRCVIDYPIYGSQVAMVFEPQRASP